MGLASFRRNRGRQHTQPPSQVTYHEHSRAIQELTVKYEKEISRLKSGDSDPEEAAIRAELAKVLLHASDTMPEIHVKVLVHLSETLPLDTLKEFADFVAGNASIAADEALADEEFEDLDPKPAPEPEPEPETQPEETNDDSLTCPHCDKTYQNKAGLQSHIRAKHGDVGE